MPLLEAAGVSVAGSFLVVCMIGIGVLQSPDNHAKLHPDVNLWSSEVCEKLAEHGPTLRIRLRYKFRTLVIRASESVSYFVRNSFFCLGVILLCLLFGCMAINRLQRQNNMQNTTVIESENYQQNAINPTMIVVIEARNDFDGGQLPDDPFNADVMPDDIPLNIDQALHNGNAMDDKSVLNPEEVSRVDVRSLPAINQCFDSCSKRAQAVAKTLQPGKHLTYLKDFRCRQFPTTAVGTEQPVQMGCFDQILGSFFSDFHDMNEYYLLNDKDLEVGLDSIDKSHYMIFCLLQERRETLQHLNDLWSAQTFEVAFEDMAKHVDPMLLVNFIELSLREPSKLTLNDCPYLLPLLHDLLDSQYTHHHDVSLAGCVMIMKKFGCEIKACRSSAAVLNFRGTEEEKKKLISSAHLCHQELVTMSSTVASVQTRKGQRLKMLCKEFFKAMKQVT